MPKSAARLTKNGGTPDRSCIKLPDIVANPVTPHEIPRLKLPVAVPFWFMFATSLLLMVAGKVEITFMPINV